MVFTKLIKVIFFPVKILIWAIGVFACAALIVLLFSTPAEGLDARQKGAISQNCSSIKQSLEQLQKVDSRTRTYLGTTYETIANKFITPLNLSLVKNNRPTFSDIQTNFMSGQSHFREDYTIYMRELEKLIGIDCQNNADEFYDQLVTVRKKRANLRTDTEDMLKLAQKQYQSAEKLKQSLQGQK